MNALSLKELESQLEKISKNEKAVRFAYSFHESAAEARKEEARSFASQAKEFRARAKVCDDRASFKKKQWEKLTEEKLQIKNKISDLKFLLELTDKQTAIKPEPKQWEPSEIKLKSREILRTHNRLLAYVDEFGGDWVANWDAYIQVKYSIHCNSKDGTWGGAWCTTSKVPGTVYMSKQCQKGLIAKLKSGEVVL